MINQYPETDTNAIKLGVVVVELLMSVMVCRMYVYVVGSATLLRP